MGKRPIQGSGWFKYPKPPKPKKKGKVKVPGFKTSSSVDPLDIFKSVLEADAGGESSGQDSSALLETFASILDDRHLQSLDKKICKMRDKTLEKD